MASMTDVKCAACGQGFQARTADVARGWGKYCSKSCKGRNQHGTCRPGRKTQSHSPVQPPRPSFRGKTCAFCPSPAINAFRTNFDNDGEAEWSSRQGSYLMWFCEEHEFEAEMAVSYDGEF